MVCLEPVVPPDATGQELLEDSLEFTNRHFRFPYLLWCLGSVRDVAVENVIAKDNRHVNIPRQALHLDSEGSAKPSARPPHPKEWDVSYHQIRVPFLPLAHAALQQPPPRYCFPSQGIWHIPGMNLFYQIRLD